MYGIKIRVKGHGFIPTPVVGAETPVISSVEEVDLLGVAIGDGAVAHFLVRMFFFFLNCINK